MTTPPVGDPAWPTAEQQPPPLPPDEFPWRDVVVAFLLLASVAMIFVGMAVLVSPALALVVTGGIGLVLGLLLGAR